MPGGPPYMPDDDASSIYSSSTGVSISPGRPGGMPGYTRSLVSDDSSSSSWSSSESVSYVYRDDPWGYGVQGAVTRQVDRRANPNVKWAAHILSGPFAQFRRKKHNRSHSGSSRRSNQAPAPGPRPGPGPQFRGPPPPQFRGGPPPPPPGFMGGPPPPPPPQGFQPSPGFIHLGGPGAGGPPSRPVDPLWGQPQGPQGYPGGG